MKTAVTVRQVADNADALRRAIAALTEQDVYIGVPADDSERGDLKRKDHGSNGRAGGGPTNAEIAYWQENGIPSRNVPARPALLPGIRDIQGEAAELLKDAAQKALEGNENAVNAALNKIGQLGQNAVRARFVNNNWKPLADSTLDYHPLVKSESGETLRDKKGNPLRKKSRREKGRVNPRMDTGQNRKAYTYVIRRRGAAMMLQPL